MTHSLTKPAAESDARTVRSIPGEPGIWLVIFGDFAAFSALFVTFMFYRGQSPETFASGLSVMNVNIALANTLVLLTGSLAVVQAVGAYKMRDAAAADRAALVAILCAATFLVLKSVEYWQKITQGFLPNTNTFFTLYYTFTGLHFVHVIFGIGILIYLRAVMKRQVPDTHDLKVVESGGIFWHLVDLLWIVLFALFYLVYS